MNYAFEAICEAMKNTLMTGQPNFIGYKWAAELPASHSVESMADQYGVIASHDKTRDGFYIQRVEVTK